VVVALVVRVLEMVVVTVVQQARGLIMAALVLVDILVMEAHLEPA
jgi:hypothetical protein